nr:hypothetical protein [Tanacetum cinerariifolium]
TNEVDTTNIQVSTVSTPVSTVSSHDNTANLSDATVYVFLANQPNGSQLVHEDLEQIHKDDLKEIDLKWQLALLSMRARRSPRKQESRPRNQDSSRKTMNVEDTSSKAMVAIDGACFDWIYMADDVVPTNMALMAFSDSEEFQHLDFKGYGPKDSKSICVNTSNEIKKALDALIIEDWVSVSDEDESEEMVLKSDNVQHKPEQANQPRKSGIVPISTARQSSSRATAPVSAARPINTAASKPLVNVAKPRQNALHKSHTLSRRPFYQQTTLKNKILNNKVNTAKVNSVNTTKGNRVTSAIGKQGINVVNSSAYWVWRPKLKYKIMSPKIVDHTFVSDLTMHMTGNISYLTDFKEHDRGYVAFGRGAKGSKITGKGTIKTADESQVLLKVPRKNNMYSFDMKNIVLQKDLTCLFTKATND